MYKLNIYSTGTDLLWQLAREQKSLYSPSSYQRLTCDYQLNIRTVINSILLQLLVKSKNTV